MVAVAHRRLRHLRDQCLRKAQQEQLQSASHLEVLFQRHGLDPKTLASTLHHRAARGGLAAHEKRDAD
jgi:hypothetical protein